MDNDLNSLLDILKPALDVGCHFEISSSEGIISIDLNTMAKSHCILKLEEDGIYAYRRYNRRDKVENFEDILGLVYGCAHGRSFFNGYWLELFTKNNMKNPCGVL